MYSTLAIAKNSKKSGRIAGTHQQVDRAALKIIKKYQPQNYAKLPDINHILNFEGMGGPDGLKRKSPGVDEPMHFIIPGNDDKKLITIIKDHHYNLKKALREGNTVRASFEMAWMAHAITDGLTPAHHFPLEEAQKQLMTEKEFVKVFGIPIKGIMHGRNVAETLRNNWIYWGADGYMSKHIAYEYGVAITCTALPAKMMIPQMLAEDFAEKNIETIFYNSFNKIAALDMYTRFIENGWDTTLATETRDILIPEITKCIALAWNSAVEDDSKNKTK